MKPGGRLTASLPRLRHGPRDLPALLRTSVGRNELRRGLEWLAWYFVAPIAALHRRVGLAGHPVVAITGTYGKTTTARAIAAALGSPAPPVNFRTYLALGLLRVRRGAPPAVFEVGISRPGQMAGYARLLLPRIAVVTAIASEHVTAFGTLERTAGEKQRLLSHLLPRDLALLRGDDPRVLAMAAQTSARVVTYGLGAGNDVRAEAVRIDWPRGTAFELVTPEGRHAVFVRPLGPHAVAATLAALAVARELGVPVETALARLASMAPAPGRLEPIELANGAWILRDDYKGGLETIESALDVLDAIPARRKWVVLGPITEPPHPARAAYRFLGARLGTSVDRVVGCGPYRNPFGALASAARSAGLASEAIAFCPDVQGAASRLAAELEPGDVVLLKGQNNLRFERIAIALAGRTVRCELRRCFAKGIACADCAMLERGWAGLRPVT